MIYELSQAGTKSTDSLKQFTQDEIIKICEDTESKINMMLAYNTQIHNLMKQDFVTHEYDNMYAPEYIYQSLKTHGTNIIDFRSIIWSNYNKMEKASDADVYIDRYNKYLTTLLVRTMQVHRIVTRGKPLIEGKWFAKISDQIDNKYNVSCISINKKIRCPICMADVSSSRLQEHQNTLKCKQKGRLTELRSKQYVRVKHGSKLHNAVINGNVTQGEMVATDYDVYVPEYINTMAEQYDADPKRFAGMTLLQLINKMYSSDT